MAGVLLEGVQIDSKSGMLTLFGPRSQDMRSVAFEVNYTPYNLVAYNLLPGQTATLYSVAVINGTTRESIFSYNGASIVLSTANPTALVAFSGMYRLVMSAPVGSAVIRAYPQHIEHESVSPVKSDIVNSLVLKAGVPSDIIQVQFKPHTVTAYDLGTGTVDIFAAFDEYNSHIATLYEGSLAYVIDRSGDYRFIASTDCLITIRPNYIDYENPYKTKGDQGEPGLDGSSDVAQLNVLNVDSVTLPPGTPVALVATGQVKRADKDITARNAIGLVKSDGLTAGGSGFIQTEGEFTLTTDQWDTVLNTVGGLVPAKNYYISGLGRLSHIPPAMVSGNYSCIVGKSITSTTMVIEIYPAYGL